MGGAGARRARSVGGAHCSPARAQTRTHEDQGASHRRGGAPRARHAPPGKAALLLHSPHRHGDPALAQQAADSERDIRVSAAAIRVLPEPVPGVEELRAAQPQPQRVLRQAAQGAGPARQGPLLDDRPVVGADVRGGVVPQAAARLPAQVPGAEDAVRERRVPVRRRRGRAARAAAGRLRAGGRQRRRRRRRAGHRVRHVRLHVQPAAELRRRVLRVRRHGRARVAAVVRPGGVRVPAAAGLLAAAPNTRHHSFLPVRCHQRPWSSGHVPGDARGPRADAVGGLAGARLHQRAGWLRPPPVAAARARAGPQAADPAVRLHAVRRPADFRSAHHVHALDLKISVIQTS